MAKNKKTKRREKDKITKARGIILKFADNLTESGKEVSHRRIVVGGAPETTVYHERRKRKTPEGE